MWTGLTNESGNGAAGNGEASHFIVDAGALELSKDPGPAHVTPQAMGAVRGAPALTVATLSQEHGLIRAATLDTAGSIDDDLRQRIRWNALIR